MCSALKFLFGLRKGRNIYQRVVERTFLLSVFRFAVVHMVIYKVGDKGRATRIYSGENAVREAKLQYCCSLRQPGMLSLRFPANDAESFARVLYAIRRLSVSFATKARKGSTEFFVSEAGLEMRNMHTRQAM